MNVTYLAGRFDERGGARIVLASILFLAAIRPALAEEEASDSLPPAEETPPASLLSVPVLAEEIWTFASSEKEAKLADTWEIRQADGETILVCTGEPYGYLKTTQVFADSTFGVEWRYPVDVNGNSGILLYTNGHEKDNVWPTAMQVQLHQPVCGSIFPSGGATSDNEIRDVREFCKPLNQWNSCEITSIGGQLSVEMNGRKVGVVTGCQPARGGIAFQSEGSEIHFRRIWVKELVGGDATDGAVSFAPRSACPAWRTSYGCDELVELDHTVVFTPPISSVGFSHHVDYRGRLAPDGYPVHAHGRLRLEVVSTSTDIAVDRHHFVRSRHRRHLAY